MTVSPSTPTGTSAVRLRWVSRTEPLPAVAVVASGRVGAALAAATARALHAGADLSAAETDGWLLVLGSVDDLPWADGARYLGRDAGLLVPTTLEPVPGAAFVAATVQGDELTVLTPDAVLRTPAPRRRADPARLGHRGG